MTAYQEIRAVLVLGGAFMVVTLPASAQTRAPAPVVAVQPPVQPAPAPAPKPSRFLLVDGVAGESVDAAHPGWMEIASFNWGVTATVAPGGAGTRTTRTGLSSFVFTKNVDKTSAAMQKAAAAGSPFKTVVLDLVSRTKGEYYQATMSDVLVSSYRVNNSGQDRPTESMTLNFAKLEIKYGKVDPQGVRGALQRVPANWDIRQVVPN